MTEWVKDIAGELTIEDLPESYRHVAEIVGVENAVKLSEHLGGLPFYFPKLDGLLLKKRDETIRREFTGSNHRELARKYSLSEQRIRDIVQNGKDERQAELGF
jgi:Mor family transcriptional regulator